VDRLSFLLFVYGADYPRLPLLPTEFNAVSPLLDNAERWTLFVQVHADYILDKKSNATDMDSLRYWLSCERKLADWKRDKKIPTTPRVRPSTYANSATMERHDMRNATRPATKDSERDAWIAGTNEPLTVPPAPPANAVRQETEMETITRIMRLHPSARYAY